MYILFLHGLICGFQICRRKEVSWKQSIGSRAQVLANASSLEAADVSSRVPPEVERYFDVAAEVVGFSDRLHREISNS